MSEIEEDTVLSEQNVKNYLRKRVGHVLYLELDKEKRFNVNEELNK